MIILRDTDGDMQIEEVQMSLAAARYARFSRPILFDTDNIIENNQRVTLMIGDETVFVGWIVSRAPVLADSGERVAYEAVGPRAQLMKTIWKKNGSARVDYPEGTTIKSILLDVLESERAKPVVSWDGLDLVDIETGGLTFQGASVDAVITQALARAGHFGFYIDPTFKLHVLNLKTPSGKSVYVGETGKLVSQSNPMYNVITANLNFNIKGVFTKVTIEGKGRIQEFEAGLSPGWNRALESTWDAEKAGNIEAYGEVYRKFKLPHTDISSGLVTYDGGPRFWARVWNGDRSENGQRTYGQWEWEDVSGVLDSENGYVTFSSEQFELEPNNVREVSQVKGIYAVRTGDFIVSVGPEGTAYDRYGLETELYLIDDDFAYELNNYGRVVRDDTSKAEQYARAILAPLQDEKYEGTIHLHSLDTTWSLGYTLNVQNTQKDSWTELDAIVGAVSYNVSQKATTITMRSNATEIDRNELKRLLNIGQGLSRLKWTARKLSEWARNSEQTPPPSESRRSAMHARMTEEEVLKIVQAHMDKKGFCMQEHDHKKPCTGGNAWAELGGRLI